ncbi:hypothetical protein ACEPPN_002176 [Leptodophora sp. 'Broadleaf-Isolate-01']
MTFSQPEKRIHIGLCGAGLGGLAAAIALRRAVAQVTALEAATELGEIGAGIQMTPNVSRLLIKWGVADIISSDLVEFEELNMRRRDGTKMVGRHRAHLHAGLVQVAQKHGVEILINSRVATLDYTSSPDGKATVTTSFHRSHTFDLLIGSDGVNSIVRRTLFPSKDPVARELVEKLTMEVWMVDKSCIIRYPISGGENFNLVLSHHVDRLEHTVEEVDVREVRKQYEGYDERIKRIVDMIPGASR